MHKSNTKSNNKRAEKSNSRLKKKVTLFRRDDKTSSTDITVQRVKERCGPFGLIQHKVTGKEFNSFLLEIQETIIQLQQDMGAFSNRVTGIGNDLEKVDKRHNEVGETTAQVLNHKLGEMQVKLQLIEENKKNVRKLQILTVVAVVMALAELILFLVK